VVEPTAAQEEKEKLILPPIDNTSEKPRSNQVGFVEEDSAATKAASGGAWGNMGGTLK
jgi:hypothetical protein